MNTNETPVKKHQQCERRPLKTTQLSAFCLFHADKTFLSVEGHDAALLWPERMNLDAILARYFSNEHVAEWLLSSQPVREVSASSLRRAFVYSIGFGAHVLADGPHTHDVEDMYVVELARTPALKPY